jgi:hypothetical protein
MFYELLEITLIDFLHMSILNKIHAEWHNETSMFMHINEDEND